MASIEPFLQTLLGGAIALAGAFVGPFLQRKHEHWKANREDSAILRNKAQELFDEFDRIKTGSGLASVRAMQMLKDKNLEAMPVPDLGKIRAISVIYFPGLLPIVKDFEQKHTDLTKNIFDETKKAVDSGDAGLDALKALPILMVTHYQGLVSEFVQEMRDNISGHVPVLNIK